MTPKESFRLVRVGAFVGLSLVILVVVLALLGRSRSLFSTKALLYASFDNISGLVVGSPVRPAGVDIGVVQNIVFDRDLLVKKVRITLGVQGKYLDRICTDSVARLSSKGLLGDMLINISIGSPNFPRLHGGDTLKAQESEGLSQVVQSVQDGIGEVRKLVGHVDDRLRVVLSDQVAHDLQRVVHASAGVDGSKLLTAAQLAAIELAAILTQVRQGGPRCATRTLIRRRRQDDSGCRLGGDRAHPPHAGRGSAAGKGNRRRPPA